MKFLCVRCDEAMKLERVEGPEDGSLSVLFACAACGNRVAMLANPRETQLVRALDVKIGGRSLPPEPMEFVRSMLVSGREAGLDAAASTAAPSGCPFSAMANLAAERADTNGQSGAARGHTGSVESRPTGEAPGSPGPRITWSPEAVRRLERIPEFIRPMIRQGIEQFAAQRGYRNITPDVMVEARGGLGM
ncbi:MAG TPA: hypothetical protein VLT62_04120 [Candidatus Methylomirabilis sp.]|nr:hypothetical protein [Candidatus Methylomirabilis sp.]